MSDLHWVTQSIIVGVSIPVVLAVVLCALLIMRRTPPSRP
jgi:hypothetical protein